MEMKRQAQGPRLVRRRSDLVTAEIIEAAILLETMMGVVHAMAFLAEQGVHRSVSRRVLLEPDERRVATPLPLIGPDGRERSALSSSARSRRPWTGA